MNCLRTGQSQTEFVAGDAICSMLMSVCSVSTKRIEKNDPVVNKISSHFIKFVSFSHFILSWFGFTRKRARVKETEQEISWQFPLGSQVGRENEPLHTLHSKQTSAFQTEENKHTHTKRTREKKSLNRI